MPDQRLQRRVVNEPSLAIILDQQIRAGIIAGNRLGISCLHLPYGVGTQIIVAGRSSPGDFIRARRHPPGQRTDGDMRYKAMIVLFVEREV